MKLPLHIPRVPILKFECDFGENNLLKTKKIFNFIIAQLCSMFFQAKLLGSRIDKQNSDATCKFDVITGTGYIYQISSQIMVYLFIP